MSKFNIMINTHPESRRCYGLSEGQEDKEAAKETGTVQKQSHSWEILDEPGVEATPSWNKADT